MTFPAIRPNTRTFKTAEYPVKEFSAQNGAVTRRLYGSLPSRYGLSLTYTLLTDAQVEQFMAHYDSVQGSFQGFSLPLAVVAGTSGDLQARLLDLPQIKWHYIQGQPPQIETPFTNRHNITIQLEGTLDFG